MTRPWKPILGSREDGERGLGGRAWEAIDAIARVLAEPSQDYRGDLAGGSAGIALFYAYLVRAGTASSQRYIDAISRYLDAAMDAAATQPMREGLFGGFTGIAWVLEHQAYLLAQEDDEDEEDQEDEEDEHDEDGGANEDIDQVLLSLANTTPWRHDYDLVSGLVGMGVYALERMPCASGLRMLAAIIDRLDELAETSSRGITWHTRPELLPPHQRKAAPGGLYNLGVAHGVPGVIAFLGQALAMGVKHHRLAALLDGAVAWVLSQRLPPETGSAFPWSHVPGTAALPCRLAWCYGDPGIAAALMVAAQAAGEASWREAACMIAVQANRRSLAESGVVDVGLCHGSAGLAHVYNRLYQATDEPELRNAALRWYACTLDARRLKPGATCFAPVGAGPEPGTEELGFLTGLAGVGLALLAGVSDTPPSWDRTLLISGPPCYE